MKRTTVTMPKSHGAADAASSGRVSRNDPAPGVDGAARAGRRPLMGGGSCAHAGLFSRVRRRVDGFTLLEVLVALVVLALSLGAVIQTAADYTINQVYLRDRTFAQWVARNQLATALIADSWPSTGQQKGEVEFPEGGSETGGREWRWVMQVTQTPEADLRRLDIEIFPLNADKDEPPLAVLSGFVGRQK